MFTAREHLPKLHESNTYADKATQTKYKQGVLPFVGFPVLIMVTERVIIKGINVRARPEGQDGGMIDKGPIHRISYPD